MRHTRGQATIAFYTDDGKDGKRLGFRIHVLIFRSDFSAFVLSVAIFLKPSKATSRSDFLPFQLGTLFRSFAALQRSAQYNAYRSCEPLPQMGEDAAERIDARAPAAPCDDGRRRRLRRHDTARSYSRSP